ncbi:hypothetical protein [Paenibacillus silvae]|uniref:hypothetical protein n=1 Tax=Paenibacillus TaxID=44249 RepID=UPI00119EA859|nr:MULTISPECIES: hypothetical protein [Paenibacillus]MCK6076474.1 hypothetical protein [Paenibacillus silvae]MCK6150901.1 hypothetical protein [Paenibacillus silvae]MCK6269161.1 hypothetical protein [Paenibacillus silvae]
MILGWGKQTNLSASRTRLTRSSRVSQNVSDNQANLVKQVSETSQEVKEINKDHPQVKGKAGGEITDG